MNIVDFCELYASATKIPIACYSKSNKLIASFLTLSGKAEINILSHLLDFMKQAKKNPFIHMTDTEGFYGVVQLDSTKEYVLIGPIFSIPLSEAKLYEYMRENAIPIKNKDKVRQYLQNLPMLPYQRFLVNLQFLYFCLNEKKINIYEHFNITTPVYRENIASQHSLQSFNQKENFEFHNTYLHEQQILNFVKNGEMEKLKSFLELRIDIAHLNEGILADTPLRQSKNIFIGFVTLVGKQGAIPGGLDQEETYQLIDIYIQECEKLSSINEVADLHYTMLIDFCERVKHKRIPDGLSKEVYESMNFIKRKTNVAIQISDVAEHIDKSTSYISHKFKDELGFSIGAYINRCKLEEAKSLLTFSSKSIAEISAYLCFSSQSYFQNVFKKNYGITPNQYRKKEQSLKKSKG